jgi:DNA-binding response OmpR family regulator
LILEAPDAESGLEAARQEAFDVLVIDFHLPGNDGAEFVRELRIEYSLSQIIMVVASPDLAQMNKLFDLGVFALLRKPLDASQLVGSVERILRARQRLTL